MEPETPGEERESRLDDELGDRLDARIDDRLDARLDDRLDDGARASTALRRSVAELPPGPERDLSRPATAPQAIPDIPAVREDIAPARAGDDDSDADGDEELSDENAEGSAGPGAADGENAEVDAAGDHASADSEEAVPAAGFGGGANQDEQLEDAALAIPFVPKPLADRRGETPRLPSFLLDVDVDTAPFAAQRGLGVKPAGGTQDMPAYLQTYEASFGAAVDRIRRGYDDVLATARAQVQQLKLVQAHATAMVQRAQDEALETVDRRLGDERQVLERGEEAAIHRLALIADTSRLFVRRAAQSALATVAARKSVIRGHMTDAEAQRDTVLGTLDEYLVSIDLGGLNASVSFTALAAAPAPAHFPNAREPAGAYSPEMDNAMNEDLDPVVAHHAAERSTAYTTAQRIFGDNINNAHTSFTNSANSAFAPFQSYITMLSTAAPEQIGKLRRKALKSIDRMEKRAQRTIRENRNKADVSLVERHAQLRPRLVQQAEAMAGAQNKGIQGAANAQLKGFAALAAAQAPTVTALRKRIEGQQAAPAEQFAKFVIAASQRTGEQAGALAVSRLGQATARARAMSGSMIDKADTAVSSEEETARQAGDQLGKAAAQAAETMMRATLSQETALRRSAEPVAQSIDSFRIPAEEELTTMESELLRLLGQATEQAQAAWLGTPGPRSENASPPATTSEPPPAGTGSSPAEFVEKAEARTLAPEDDPNITTMADRIGGTVSDNVVWRGEGLVGQMSLLGQNPQETLGYVRGLTYLRGQAVIRYYDTETGGSLWDDIATYMSFGNLATGIDTRVESGTAVYNYLLGRRAEGALHEVQAATEWWNDPDQAMAAMEALSPADMEALRALDPDGTILDEVADDLGDNDGRAFNILREATADNARESMAAARALRLGDRIEDDLGSHPERGADAAFDSMERVALQVGNTRLEGVNEYGLDANFEVESREARAARTREGWADTVARLGNDGERRADGMAGGLRWLDAAAAERRTYWETDFNAWGLVVPGVPLVEVNVWQANIRPEQRDLLHSLAEFGPGDPRTRARQLAVEDTRPGGAKRERFEHAMYDPRTNADMANPDDPNARVSREPRPGDPPTDLELGLAEEAEMLRWYDEYRNGHPHDNPRPIEDIRRDLGASIRAGASDERLGRLLEMQVTRGLTDPETAALAFEHAVDRWGTDEQLLKDTLRRMSPDQAREAVARYDATHDPGLYERLGLFNHEDDWFTELSGDDRIEIQALAMGQPRNARERAEVSHMTSRLQMRNASWLSSNILARGEYRRMAASHDRLTRAMGVTEADFDAFGRLRAPDGTPVGNWDERGNFRPNGEMGSIAFARAMATNDAAAANYRTTTDNIANAVSMAIVIAAAVISTFFTGGAAASLWIPALITLGGGVVAMGANWAIKGGRYGYEDMGRDFGMAVVQAATAGLASGMSIGMTGGAAALRTAATGWRVSTAGFRAATLVDEAIIAGTAGAFGGAGNAMFDDKAWDNGEWFAGLGRGFERGAGGGFLGGLATGITTRAVGGLAGSVGRMRGARDAAALGLSGNEASRLAMARAAAARQSLPVTLAGRTLGGGLGGAVTRGYEIGYDRSQGRYRGSFANAMDEISAAGLQNAAQSFAEGVVEHRYGDNPAAEAWRARLFGGPLEPGAVRAPRPGVTHDSSPPPVRPIDGQDGPEPGRQPVAANDNAPGEGTGTPPRRLADDESGNVTTRVAQPEEGFLSPSARAPIADETALPAPALRLDGEPEPVARLRSALGDEDGPARLRSGDDFDEITQPGVPVPHPEFPNGVNLKPGDLDHLPVILPDTVVRGTNPRDAAQARQNYDIMRARTPNREVLLAHNPRTGEYMVVQGLPRSVTPPPEGWITLRHSHPRVVGGDQFSHFASILPSGIGGDFSVLRTEVDRIAAQFPDVTVRRVSTIDIEVNGQHVQTVFEISRTGDSYTLSVTLNPPQHGVDGIGPITGNRDEALREYAYKARDLTAGGSDFGLGHNKNAGPDLLTESGRPDTPSRVIRGASLGEPELADASFVAGRMVSVAEFERQVRGAAPRGELDPVIARAAASLDAQERVRAMGLVGEPDSLQRLTRLLNSSDQSFTPEMRAAVARAALEATRTDLIRSGNLAPGDELLMLFRGVTGARTGDYENEGMNLSRLGPGGDEDAGRGLYGSQDFESALRYAGSDGQGAVLPLIVRRSELGNVIDVRSGTPLGDRWLAYVRATARGGVVKDTHPHLARVLYPFTDSPIGVYRDGRGDRFDAFLRTLADDPTLPAAIREAARDPHITLMDLGGVASWGNDRSMLTDQFAMHHQRVLDLFNDAHGFPVPGRGGADGDEPARLRSALGDDAPDADVPPVAKPSRPEDAVERPDDAPARSRADDDEDIVAAATRRSQESSTDEFLRAMDEANAELHAPRPPANTYDEAIDAASNHQRRDWHDRAMAEFAAQNPADFARLQALIGNDIAAIRNAVSAANDRGREQQIVYLVNRMKARGHSEADATRIAREVIGLASDMHHRFALTMRHLVEREIWSGRVAALPVAVRSMAESSNLLLFLGAHHPALLQGLHTDFLAQPNFRPEMNTPALFEEFVARRLAGHPAIQAETTGRRIVRFTSEADFNEAAASATPHTRYEFERLAYTTDANGRVQVAEGVPVRVTGHRGSSSLQTEIGNRGHATDVGFHLIAHIFGAVVNELTVVPGNGKRISGDPEPNLNGSAYKVEFENIVRRILDTTAQIVEVEVVCVYDSGNTTSRPDHFLVRFRTDAGRWVVVSFVNKF